MTETAAKYEVDLACPFCGSSDSQRSTLYVESEGTELVPVGDIGEVETVSCNACWAEAPVHIWNGRAAKDAEIARLREALEERISKLDRLLTGAVRSGPSAAGYVRDSTYYGWNGEYSAYREALRLLDDRAALGREVGE